MVKYTNKYRLGRPDSDQILEIRTKFSSNKKYVIRFYFVNYVFSENDHDCKIDFTIQMRTDDLGSLLINMFDIGITESECKGKDIDITTKLFEIWNES